MSKLRMISRGGPGALTAAGYTPLRVAIRQFVSGDGPVHRGPCACSCCSAYYEGRLITGRHYEYNEVWVSEELVSGGWELVTDKLGVTDGRELYSAEMVGEREYIQEGA